MGAGGAVLCLIWRQGRLVESLRRSHLGNMFRENVEIHTAWTEFLAQSVLELFLPLAVLSLPWTFCVGPRNDTNRGTRCGSLRPRKLSGAARHSQRPLLPSLCSFGLERLDELLEISQLLISSIDFSKTQIYIFFPSAELKMLKTVPGSPQTGWI